ncbi:MFS transporter [Tuwongella immobilis]|uniref:Major facilitator superfamily (MFS) profile domain-containing protein n=1 Tax=Tuwongella immobilis TaxID=692036 RepID=A0A6C2YIB4_9BACT|nr:MFS transporter [Tuwongella immobilis]VIP01270.1 multidrug resistance protein : Major facilitator superfamily MFS_1 transporter OS=Planctomyces maris DSM 8797 GN=PM8797T_28394 PE=4 SV=1: MFS_1 [Tuwongella immobilis]VTR97966.1 multidrug resistance protein : Major facilitator superfamily MFS_1 transporter OS=Planctomyces maris DSM 8797 GN=PM8797T_28394 PE=4 SV=1: MFS_1 [Tuwongella immobilis]
MAASQPTDSNQPTNSDPASTAAPVDSLSKRALFLVFVVVFLDLLGFGIVLPILPRIADDYLPAEWPAAARGVSLGILYSCFSAMQFLFSPIWGRMSDRVGRKPILMLGLAGSVVFYALFGFAGDLPAGTSPMLGLALIFIARSGAGIAGATVAVAQAVIADCTTPEKRSRGMALIGAAFGIGFTFGPLLAYGSLKLFPDWNGGVGYLASGLSLVALLFCWKRLPETRKPGGHSEHRSWLNFKQLRTAMSMPQVGALVWIFFFATFAFATFEGTLSLLNEKFGYDNTSNFVVFAFIGFTLMIANGLFYRRLAKKLPEQTLLRIGVVLLFIGIAGLAAVASQVTRSNEHGIPLTVYFVVLGISVCGFAFMTPSVQSLISRRSDPNRQGEVLGVNQSFAALARILGPTIGLTIFPLTNAPLLPYAMSAALLGIAGILALRLPAEEKV